MHYSLLPILLILFSPLQVFSHTIGADFDGNGSVGFSDFVLFAQGYGTTQERFDLTQDGKVDFDDFVAFDHRSEAASLLKASEVTTLKVKGCR